MYLEVMIAIKLDSVLKKPGILEILKKKLDKPRI